MVERPQKVNFVTPKSEEKPKTVPELAAEVEAAYDADVLIYYGPIARRWDDHLIDECAKRKKRKNVLLMLTTTGGDAHAAYRIARCLNLNYRNEDGGKVLVFVNSICASAGTLTALIADKLILSDHAELGPIDVQISKPDEIGERTSGLTPIQAMNFLEGETGKFFSAQFRNSRFTLSFSTKMAADISATLASGLLSKLYEQIDPLRLAEYARLLSIAQHYGERIKSKNVKDHAIRQLLEGYPSHDCCIDPTEAKELFFHVEKPNAALEALGAVLKPVEEKYLENDQPAVTFLTPNKTEPVAQNEKTATGNGSSDSNGDTRQPANGEQAPPQTGDASGAPKAATVA